MIFNERERNQRGEYRVSHYTHIDKTRANAEKQRERETHIHNNKNNNQNDELYGLKETER